MRKDMYDVLLGNSPPKGWTMLRRKPARQDIEDAPARENILRRGHWLSLKSLNPLRRYLASQAGRPWNEVYAELCGQRRTRQLMHAEIFRSISWLVALDVQQIAGGLHARHTWRGMLPLAEIEQLLYVDPANGRLMINAAAIGFRADKQREHRMRVRAHQLGLEPDLRRLGEKLQLRRIEGVWYEVELAPVPPRPEPRKPGQRQRGLTRAFAFDAVNHKKITNCDGERCRMYGSCKLYAARKRQLAHAELIRYGLSNGFEPDPYLRAGKLRKPRPQPLKFRIPIRNGAQHKEH